MEIYSLLALINLTPMKDYIMFWAPNMNKTEHESHDRGLWNLRAYLMSCGVFLFHWLKKIKLPLISFVIHWPAEKESDRDRPSWRNSPWLSILHVNPHRASSNVMVISLVEDVSCMLGEERASCESFSRKQPGSLGCGNAVLSLLNIKTTDDIRGEARKLASGAFFLMNKKI